MLSNLYKIKCNCLYIVVGFTTDVNGSRIDTSPTLLPKEHTATKTSKMKVWLTLIIFNRVKMKYYENMRGVCKKMQKVIILR